MFDARACQPIAHREQEVVVAGVRAGGRELLEPPELAPGHALQRDDPPVQEPLVPVHREALDGDRHVVVVMNLTPVPREDYRIGVPGAGTYRKLLSSDDSAWGGSGHAAVDRLETEPSPFHGFAQSLSLTLPPLGAVVFAPDDRV